MDIETVSELVDLFSDTELADIIVNELYTNYIQMGNSIAYISVVWFAMKLENENSVYITDDCVYALDTYVNNVLKTHLRVMTIETLLK